MNKSFPIRNRATSPLLAAAISALLVAGCATTPESPSGAAEIRNRLGQLKADPNLAPRATVELREAEAAVNLAEEPIGNDTALGEHRVLIADRKVEIARARAETRYAEDQRSKIREQREEARLQARTREADRAREEAQEAQAQVAGARREADSAEEQAAELRRRIEELEARETDRGLVLTLGDVLFATDQSTLKAGATDNLEKLATFLNEYSDRNVIIEGHTDSVGSADYNQGLSQRRADAVKSWLMQRGISSRRLIASGKGENQPVADNSTVTGRQMNRRVEVIIENNPVVSGR